MLDLEQILEMYRRDREIHCPHCGELHPNDDFQYPVTYWGEDDPVELTCYECEKTFLVKEHIERTYEVMEVEDERT